MLKLNLCWNALLLLAVFMMFIIGVLLARRPEVPVVGGYHGYRDVSGGTQTRAALNDGSLEEAFHKPITNGVYACVSPYIVL